MVKLVGGCAGDELALSSTWQICGGDVYTGSVIGIAIGSDGPMGVGLGHGWTSSGETMVVTDSDGQRIFKLDDKPALDLYLDHAGVTSDQLEDPEQWADAMHKRPLGLPRPSGIEVRAVLGADLDDRSLICGDVPQGAIITVMKGDTGTVNEGTRQACVEVLADLGGAAPVGVMAFDCAGRRSVLGEDGVITEMATMAQFFNDVPIGGFYTYGEVARKAGSRGVHNATLVLFALG
jgi:hypothetical protein